MPSLSTWVSLESLVNSLSKRGLLIVTFFLTVLEILLLEGKSVVPPTQLLTRSERVSFSVKIIIIKKISYLKIDCGIALEGFYLFFILFNPFAPGKFEKSNF